MKLSTRKPILGMRSGLILLVLLAVLPSLGIILHDGLEQRARAEAESKDRAMRIAHQAAARQEALIASGRHLLAALARLSAVRNLDAESCSSLFAELLPDDSYFTALLAITSAGDVFCSAASLSQPVSVVDRPYFQPLVNEPRFTTSGYMIGRISGKPTLGLYYPVLDEGGELVAIVSAGIDLAWLSQVVADAALPPGSVLSVFDSEGTILARFPDPGKWVGEMLLSQQLRDAILGSDRDGTLEADGGDGIRRLYAFTPLHTDESLKTYVAVGIPTEIAFAETNETTRRNIFVLATAAALALSAAWVVGDHIFVKNVRKLIGAAQRLASGEGGVTSGFAPGLREFNQLGAAFDRMAGQIERQRVELRLAEAKYRSLVEGMPAVTYEVALVGKGELRYISPQAEALLGFLGSAWKEDPDLWRSRIHPEDQERVRSAFSQGRPGGRVAAEYRLLSEDGSVKWVSNLASIVPAEDGRPGLLLGVVTDITERKRMEEALRENERLFRTFFQLPNAGKTEYDPGLERFLRVNDKFCEITGYSEDELLQMGHNDLTHPEDRRRDVEIFEAAVRGEIESWDVEKRYLRKDGSLIWVRVSGSLLKDELGRPLRSHAVIQDITAWKNTEAVLHRKMAELACLHAISSACMKAVDEADLLNRATRAVGEHLFSQNFGLLLVDQTTGTLRLHLAYDKNGVDGALAVPLGRGITGQTALDGIVRRVGDISREEGYIAGADGIRSELCVPLIVGDAIVGVINAESNQPDAFNEADERVMVTLAEQLAIAIQRLRFERELERLAATDELTGADNRRRFLERAEREFRRAKRFNHYLSALVFDIDRFKSINDTYGHAAGDKVLQEVVLRCRRLVREVDPIGRMGGDEFALLLVETGLPEAKAVSERLRQAMASEPVQTEAGPVEATISLGIAGFTGAESCTITKLLESADIALYQAKKNGRNRVVGF